MPDDATAAMPQETGAPIDHILTTCHKRHRPDLAFLVPLAKRVEQVQADDPDAPTGPASALNALACKKADHMAKEETILFPAKRAGDGAGLGHPIAVMRADHDDHAETITLMRKLAADLTPPEHACGSWRSLCGGAARLLDELANHIALENSVLRFEPAR